MRSKMLKRMFMVLLCAVMAFTATAITPVSSSALTQQQIKDKIADYEQQAKEIKKKIQSLQGDKNKYKELKNSLDDQIDNMQKQIDLVNDQITSLNNDIAKNEEEIKEKETEMEAVKDKLKQRLRAIYVAGSHNELQVIMGADDFADFLARAELMRGVTKHDTGLMEQIRKDIEDINAKKAEIEQKKKETNALKSTLVSKQNELDKQYDQANSLYNKIKNQESSLEADAAKVEAAKKEMQKEWEKIIAEESDSDRIYSGDFCWPFQSNYYISSPYGWRSRCFHTGVDISCSGAYGKPIYAAADGKVIKATWSNYSYGNHLIIDHGNKNGTQYTTLYAHCSTLLVSYGQEVKKGQLIARCGSTGNSTGPHLHFEIRLNGSHTNPMNYFRNF